MVEQQSEAERAILADLREKQKREALVIAEARKALERIEKSEQASAEDLKAIRAFLDVCDS